MRGKRWFWIAMAVWIGVSMTAGEAVSGAEIFSEEMEQGGSDLEKTEAADIKMKKAEKVYLGIDTVHTYETMSGPFSQGYIPAVEGDTVHLAVPFTASGKIKDNQLTVGLDLGADGPFVYANYQKNVEKKMYTFGEEQTETYLYLCDIGLDQDRMNGKYPVTVKAAGYTEQGREVKLEYRIFITITDGKNSSDSSDKNENNGQGADKSNADSSNPDGSNADGSNADGSNAGGSNAGDSNADGSNPDISNADMPDPTGEISDDILPQDEAEGLAGVGGGEDFGGISASGGDEEEVIHQPKLILESSNLSGERLKAGESRDFVLKFKNRSRTEKIYNLKATVKAGEDTVFLQNNSFYYDSVAPQETIELSTVAAVSPVAEQKNVPVEFTFEYENDKGTAYTGTEQAWLSVYQPAEAVLEGVSLPDTVYSLENVDVGMQVRNLGKAPIYNVQVQLEGAGLFPMETAFGGNMEAGSSADVSMRVYVGNKNMTEAGQEKEGSEDEKYGSVTGKLILTYEDAFGESYSQEQEFVTVIRKPQLTELKVEKEKKETNQWWAAAFILVILLFSGIVGGMGWKLRKSRNRMADLMVNREGRHVT